jgi:hypothetical protein
MEVVFVDHVFSFGNPVFGRLTRYASALYDHFVTGRLYETGGAAFRLCHFVVRHQSGPGSSVSWFRGRWRKCHNVNAIRGRRAKRNSSGSFGSNYRSNCSRVARVSGTLAATHDSSLAGISKPGLFVAASDVSKSSRRRRIRAVAVF